MWKEPGEGSRCVILRGGKLRFTDIGRRNHISSALHGAFLGQYYPFCPSPLPLLKQIQHIHIVTYNPFVILASIAFQVSFSQVLDYKNLGACYCVL